ncbi:DNA replication initiation control protein YabA [Tetragenococcus koreensis]|nr:DNA replication initiation control protein YabA [Tetragenococcus koreensis]MCF1584274.1 DNA replication initiation control protein YabA [Tetragenococcus koreensis]MCF1613792.1 DNA replication initiation control protein YabA [Tetragenococcus koreensis]MCF1616635.1 DNA replication initiation control protein YabA [Tetragenococcus koreensis]MCF1620534.1 DNA replication initiation control protein YabA [Tetragenococcus koreensis]MCF1621508.1 DNA replication initiation control protein YabA [Tetrag
MDKRSLYDGLNEFEEDLQKLSQNLVEMKGSLQELVEKNTTLELENQRLRERIHELSHHDSNHSEKEKQELSQSRMNLEKIYEEGFHVCYDLYGSRREHDEPCAFCLEVIYRDSGK